MPREQQPRLIDQSRPLAVLVTTTILATIWLAGRSYQGLWHDAWLYAAQAMSRLHPEAYARDLFFSYGSQDSFSVFSWFSAPLIQWLGLEYALFALALGGVALWTLFAALLVSRFFSGQMDRTVALVLLFALPRWYGARMIFSAGEMIATPRVWSEAAVLAALWLWSDQYQAGRETNRERASSGSTGAAEFFLSPLRTLSVVSCLVAALLLHPLMAAVGVLFVSFDWLVSRSKFGLGVLGIVGGSIGVLSMAWLGREPFTQLFGTFDLAWLEIVRSRSPWLFLGDWTTADWCRFSWTSLVVGFGIRLFSGWRSRWLALALFLAIAGLVANGIGADLLRNPFLTQLQFYRSLWLLQLFVPIAGAAAVLPVLRENRATSGCLALLVFGSGLVWFGVGALQTVTGVLLAAQGLFCLTWRAKNQVLESRAVSAAVWMGAIAVIFSSVFGSVQQLLAERAVLTREVGDSLSLLDESLAVAALLVLLPLLLMRPSVNATAAIALVAAVVCLANVVRFDQRHPLTKAIEQQFNDSEMEEWVPVDGVVFWQESVLHPWFLLRRSNFVSRAQGAGVVFNRDNALEYDRRRRLVGDWFPESGVRGGTSKEAAGDSSRRSPRLRALTLCRQERDFFGLALLEPLPSSPVAGTWPTGEARASRVRVIDSRLPKFHFYRCADLR